MTANGSPGQTIQQSTPSSPHSIYARAPLGVHDGIPLFSATDPYTHNYDAISRDHLAAEALTGHNPWYPESLWQAAQASTVALVKRYSRPGSSILDVGVGLGVLLAHLAEWKRYGMDISLPYLERARSVGIEVCYSRVEDMPYHPNSFDTITCTDVLEHVFDLHLCCRKILSVLKPGGVLVVRVPNRQDLSEYTNPDYPYQFVHVRNFDEASLRLHFEKVMGCEFLELLPASYWPASDRLRWRLPIPKFGGLMRRSFLGLMALHAPSANRVLPAFFHPDEINIAVRKPLG